MNKKNFLPLGSLFFCAALYLIWPLAHTITLRKLLLLITAGVGVMIWMKSDDRYALLKSPWLIFLGLLLVWVVYHAGFISQNGIEAWEELRGQWIPAYLAVLAGIGLAYASRTIDSYVFRMYLLVVLAAQPILFLLVSIYESLQLGHLATGLNVITLGTDLKTSLTFSSDMLAALACSKLVDSFKSDTRNRAKYVWLLSIALAMFVAISSESLNSILLITACIILTLVLLVYKFKKNISRRLVTLVIVIMTLTIYVFSYIPSVELGWKRIISNTKVAVDIDKYTHWTNIYNVDYPSNEFGERLPISFYFRVAYATAGVRVILEHPLGYGVTRHAFERLMQQKYPNVNPQRSPNVNIANAHNGYINLSCAVGIPGLLFFVLVIIASFRQLMKSDSELAHPAAWMIGIYVGHWALDALERDHFFESYLFVIALLLTMTHNKFDQSIKA